MRKQNYSEINFDEDEKLQLDNLNKYYTKIIENELNEVDLKILNLVEENMLIEMEENRRKV